VLRYEYDQDFTFNQIYQVGAKCIIGRRTAGEEEPKRSQIRMVPVMDELNQIKGGKILIGDESITFLSGNDDYPAFREDFTETWIKVNRTGAEISWI
jgi:hypothetical protein